MEVVLPRWVLPDDVHLPPLPGAPRSRRRRRPRVTPAASRARPSERALLLHLPAFGRDLYLQLRPDLRFLSRGFEVEEADAAGRRGRPAELCFYSGRVLGHPGSLVSLSACGAGGGLVLLASPPRDCLSFHPGSWDGPRGGLGWGLGPPLAECATSKGALPLAGGGDRPHAVTFQSVYEQRG